MTSGRGTPIWATSRSCPIQKLKVDQSFVRGLPEDEGDRAIVGAVISMGMHCA